MNDKIKWQLLFKHGIEENGKFESILSKNTILFFSIYRQYHGEIIKRVAPTMRAIAKKRKKKEQEDLANTNKLTKIQEVNIIEKENDRQIETTSIPPPSNNRIASPLPNLVNKQSNQIQSLPVKGMKKC